MKPWLQRVHDDPSTVNAVGAHFDVLIVGAGLSGIGAACHLVRKRRGTTFAILEARNAIGGTWDLFRYPGIRSDSDMSTFGYAFRPWNDATAIADGPSILRYLAETAKAYGVDRHIRFGLKVVRASWRSDERSLGARRRRSRRRDAQSFPATFSSCARAITNMRKATRQAGQAWSDSPGASCIRRSGPKTCVTTDKRVVVIGSGATAVTIVPAMAAKSCACRHAATIANLCRRSPGRGSDRRPAQAMASGAHRARGRALEEHPLADVPLPAFAAQTGRDAGANHQARASRDWPRVQCR